MGVGSALLQGLERWHAHDAVAQPVGTAYQKPVHDSFFRISSCFSRLPEADTCDALVEVLGSTQDLNINPEEVDGDITAIQARKAHGILFSRNDSCTPTRAVLKQGIQLRRVYRYLRLVAA